MRKYSPLLALTSNTKIINRNQLIILIQKISYDKLCPISMNDINYKYCLLLSLSIKYSVKFLIIILWKNYERKNPYIYIIIYWFNPRSLVSQVYVRIMIKSRKSSPLPFPPILTLLIETSTGKYVVLENALILTSIR